MATNASPTDQDAAAEPPKRQRKRSLEGELDTSGDHGSNQTLVQQDHEGGQEKDGTMATATTEVDNTSKNPPGQSMCLARPPNKKVFMEKGDQVASDSRTVSASEHSSSSSPCPAASSLSYASIQWTPPPPAEFRQARELAT